MLGFVILGLETSGFSDAGFVRGNANVVDSVVFVSVVVFDSVSVVDFIVVSDCVVVDFAKNIFSSDLESTFSVNCSTVECVVSSVEYSAFLVFSSYPKRLSK